MENQQTATSSSPAATFQSGWGSNDSVGPTHGQIYQHGIGSISSPRVIQAEICINKGRNGPYMTYLDCKCKACLPKHRTIFVSQFILGPSRNKVEASKALGGFFSSTFGQVEEVTVNAKRAMGPVALIR
jgi:hypothetical protein